MAHSAANAWSVSARQPTAATRSAPHVRAARAWWRAIYPAPTIAILLMRAAPSALDPGQLHALDEALLTKEEQHNHRQREDRSGGHHHIPAHLVQILELEQPDRERQHIVAVQIQQRPLQIVPRVQK